jgi:hypothetical protein
MDRTNGPRDEMVFGSIAKFGAGKYNCDGGIIPNSMTTSLPIEAQGWLGHHEQRAWRYETPRVVTFDYYNGERIIRSESWAVSADGKSTKLPEALKTGRWRYLITVFEPNS